jgi:hypothetical protein
MEIPPEKDTITHFAVSGQSRRIGPNQYRGSALGFEAGNVRARVSPGAGRVDAVQRLARDRTQARLLEDGHLEFVAGGESVFRELLV